MSDLAIVILTYNTKDLTLKCLKSIFDSKPKLRFEVWVVDNASSDGTLEAVEKEFPKVIRIQNGANVGFSKGNNVALRKIKADYSLVLNSDTQVRKNSLDSLVEVARREGFDVTSCKLVNPDGTFQPNAGYFPKPIPLFMWLSGVDDILRNFLPIHSYQERGNSYYKGNKEVEWVSGSVLLIKKEVFGKIGYLDEKIFMYGEDVDFCMRAKKAKLKIGWTDEAEIMHISGGSSKTPKLNQWRGEFRGLLYLYRKYYGVLAQMGLKLLIYIFILARIIAFSLLGRMEYSKAYAKIFVTI